MPLLEFRCADCERKSEQLVLAGDTAGEPVCSACGSHEMQRLLSTFAAHGGAHHESEAACGGGPCAMPGVCGPSACGYGEN